MDFNFVKVKSILRVKPEFAGSTSMIQVWMGGKQVLNKERQLSECTT
jgi:hypothetical protein